MQVDFTVRFILDELGIEIEEPEADKLDELLEPFGGILPSTVEFSRFTRLTLKGVNSLDDPDKALVEWMDHEEKLFRRMERFNVEKRIREGFVSEGSTDVDGFLKYSLQVQNRRKSRAGWALENHLDQIFNDYELCFSRAAVTENKSKPDFLFPGASEYHDDKFNPAFLTMLGAKKSCKDRWRQVTAEAARIEKKHLLTMEPGISLSQTNEMQCFNIQLVIPASLHASYLTEQQKWLMDLGGFIGLVQDRQKSM